MQNYNFVKNDVFVAKICKYALYESSEGLFCAPQKPANFCHPGPRMTYQGVMGAPGGTRGCPGGPGYPRRQIE